MAIRTITGSMPLQPGPTNFQGLATNIDCVFLPANPSGFQGRSPGGVRVSTIQIQPPAGSRWSLLGWAVRLGMTGYLFPVFAGIAQGAHGPCWLNAGDVWAGLLVNSPQQNAGGYDPISGQILAGQGLLPPDMSTFQKVWEQEDGFSVILPTAPTNPQPSKPPSAPATFGSSFQLPQPVPLSRADIQMALVMLPSFIDFSAGLAIACMDYTVIVDDGQGDAPAL